MKKYIIIAVAIVLVILLKPWDISFAGGLSRSNASSDTSGIVSKPPLLPVNQVVRNSDSDLPETQALDRMIRRFMLQWDIRGASFALMKGNRLVYAKGYGYSDKEAGIYTDVKHIFRVASVSKLITSIGIMKLSEEGLLRLDDKVFGPQGILHDSCFLDIKDARSKDITVEHLLRHQGGFTNGHGDPMFCPLDVATKMKAASPVSLTTTIQYVLSRPLGFTPGKGTCYSNIGYAILSEVIEKVTGMDYETYMTERILRPAGCSDMHMGHSTSKNRFANEVKYYEVANADLIPACDGSGLLVSRSDGGNNIEALGSAGGWVASPAELLRLVACIDGNPEIEDILKPETITRMTRNIPDALPIGWIDITDNGEWTRTGTLAGTSALIRKQADGYCWVFITNTSTWKGSRFPHYISSAIARALGTVTQWPERNLFDLQDPNHDQLIATN